MKMNQYPFERFDCGKQCFIPDYEVVKMRNVSFYEGYITACVDTPEELEAIDTYEKIGFMVAAIEKNAKINRMPSPQMLKKVREILYGEGEG